MSHNNIGPTTLKREIIHKVGALISVIIHGRLKKVRKEGESFNNALLTEGLAQNPT